MNPEIRSVIGALKSVLQRKPNYLEMPDETYLSLDINDLAFDSVDKLDLVMSLEEAFDIVFVTSDVLNCRTVQELSSSIAAERLRA